MSKLRIFYATDIHGSETAFRKFTHAGKVYDAQVVIVGGDITGKLIVPIVKQSDGTMRVRYLDSDVTIRNKTQLGDMEKNIKLNGYYPYLTDENEMQEFASNKTKLNELFARLVTERVQSWVKLAEERYRDTKVRAFISPGNDDMFGLEEIISKSDVISCPEGKVVELDNKHEMMSLGYGNITPWDCPRDIPEEELKKKIESMVNNVKDMKHAVFNIHVPPHDSSIDTAPELDENLKPKLGPGGDPIPYAAGSSAVREAIEKYQPMLGLHGHIHESKGKSMIGKTLCLNPGSEYQNGMLKGVIVDLNDKIDFCFTSS